MWNQGSKRDTLGRRKRVETRVNETKSMWPRWERGPPRTWRRRVWASCRFRGTSGSHRWRWVLSLTGHWDGPTWNVGTTLEKTLASKSDEVLSKNERVGVAWVGWAFNLHARTDAPTFTKLTRVLKSKLCSLFYKYFLFCKNII